MIWPSFALRRRHDPACNLVFLHIPKTAGQTVHSAISGALPKGATSPIRVHDQAPAEQQMPPGHRFYSGHINWLDLDSVPRPRFVFTVLRDPLERLASFYFYILQEAQATAPEALDLPEHIGRKRILECSADDYFLSGNPLWQRFVRDSYENVYCYYLATRRIRGRSEAVDLRGAALIAQALEGARALDRVYDLAGLAQLEQDLHQYAGISARISDRRVNAGPQEAGTPRWPQLCALFERDDTAAQLESWVAEDQALMVRMGLSG